MRSGKCPWVSRVDSGCCVRLNKFLELVRVCLTERLRHRRWALNIKLLRSAEIRRQQELLLRQIAHEIVFLQLKQRIYLAFVAHGAVRSGAHVVSANASRAVGRIHESVITQRQEFIKDAAMELL